MRKTLQVATREFLATVLTKGFILGIIVPMIMAAFLLLLMPVLKNMRPPPTRGTVALIDPTGKVAAILKEELSPEKLAERARQRRAAQMAQGQKLAESMVGKDRADEAVGMASPTGDGADESPKLTLEELPPATNAATEKDSLRDKREGADGGRVALIVIDADAVTPDPSGKLGGYRPFVRANLDERVQNLITRAVKRSIADARLVAVNYDPRLVERLGEVQEEESVSITPTGERRSIPGARYIVPIAFILLLMMSGFTGGQGLLMSTIEEKSNRIIEVLLSAVSPMELMVGKILGQMAVGLLILLTYTGLGIAALVTFALLDVLAWSHLIFLLIFFLLAFFMIASIFAAVGSAVSEIREAQSLMMPVMMVLIVPWLLMPVIVESPNSAVAVVLSVTPPVAPFVMVQRIAASTEPVPAWQIGGSIVVAAITAVVAAWAAAKIFRIGILMYGRPPNLGTLWRWVRQA